MALPPHILSVGKNRRIMSSRSMILRGAGYAVDEAYTVETAIKLVEQDSIDAALLCHTVPRSEQNALISAIHSKRRLMPILCIRSYAYEAVPKTCTAVENEPETLLSALQQVIKMPKQDPIV
jgi:DNA-binding NtrC family response regulator